jgi:hypothetical protein
VARPENKINFGWVGGGRFLVLAHLEREKLSVRFNSNQNDLPSILNAKRHQARQTGKHRLSPLPFGLRPHRLQPEWSRRELSAMIDDVMPLAVVIDDSEVVISVSLNKTCRRPVNPTGCLAAQ